MIGRKGNLIARSVLFCPTDKISMMERALGLKTSTDVLADVVILDLEDSVSPVMKNKARENVSTIMRNFENIRRERAAVVPPFVAVRINCPATTPWGIEDISLLLSVKADAVVVPKVNSRTDLDFSVGKIRSDVGIGCPPLWAMIETANGVLNASEIAKSDFVQTLVFGSNDLTKDLKAFYTDNREPLLYSMSQCILAARGAGKFVVDGVFMDVKDEEKFKAECVAGRNLGFDGKSLIHPSQVRLANEAFSPTAEQIEHAERVIEAFESASQQARGVAVVDNKLIEHLHYLQAKDILRRSTDLLRAR